MPSDRPQRNPLLLLPELFAVAVTVTLLAQGLFLAWWWQQPVEWTEVGLRVMLAVLLLAIGLGYRVTRRNEGIALAMIGAGLFVGFSNAAVLVNYLLFPLSAPLIDSVLFAFDARLGYDWSEFVLRLGERPWLGRLLSYVYLSSLLQMFGMIVLLGFLGRRMMLHRFLVTGIVAGLATITIFWLLPSFGPAAYLDLPPGIGQRIGLVVGTEYGSILMRLAREGSEVVRLSEVLGVIAFPSFHTVMAAMVVWFARGLLILWPLAALNVAMIPAILSHGGHHVADVLGGFVIFALAIVVATAMVPDDEANASQVSR